MFERFQFRTWIKLAVASLTMVVIALAVAAAVGVWKFRNVTRDIRLRADELPLAASLSNETNNLRATVWRRNSREWTPGTMNAMVVSNVIDRDELVCNLRRVVIALDQYRTQLELTGKGDSRLVDTSEEKKLVDQMERCIRNIEGLARIGSWELEDEMERLQKLANHLPPLLKERMDVFAKQARQEYHMLNMLVAVAALFGLTMLGLITAIFQRTILKPLSLLFAGTRRVAEGQHDLIVECGGSVEMRNLARAFNQMTKSFREINENLAEQVEARSRELIRSEQLASVGMLAAGVAHEINNPLASIAWSAEAMESRVEEWESEHGGDFLPQEMRDSMRKYLKRIQDEAFRCKKITCGLLDFSRLGDTRHVKTDLKEVIESVVDLVQTLGSYENRKLVVSASRPACCIANPQEIRQVILNLVTNALDSIDDEGLVEIRLLETGGEVIVEVVDNGCGMTPDTMQNLFEPFFTRRRDGKGTGLGLAISWRIVDEHNGQIHVESDGPGCGSRFQVCFPALALQMEKCDEKEHRPAA